MAEASKPSRSIRFFTGVLLVLGLLALFAPISLVLKLSHLGWGPLAGAPTVIDFLNALLPFFYLTAYFALKKGSPYGRWFGVIAFTFAACELVGAVCWYFVLYSGKKYAAATVFIVVIDLIQFLLFGWGALTFAFPPKAIPDNTPAASYLPPPPPTFDE